MPMLSGTMEEIRLAILGFGSANRALARMLLEKSEPSADKNDVPHPHRRFLRVPIANSSDGGDTRLVPWRVVCIVTRRHGRVSVPLSMDPTDSPWAVDLRGALKCVESGQMLNASLITRSKATAGRGNTQSSIVADASTETEQTINLLGILGKTRVANVVVEAIPSNPKGDGEPVLSFLSKALRSEMHVVSANKSPLAHRSETEETYWALQRLARQNNVLYKHESAVMDGVPIFSLWKHTLPHAKLTSLRGCLNSTTTMILSGMEGNLEDGECNGESFEEALDAAKRLGIVEEDESLDVDGYDAAVKLRALLVCCNAELPVPTMEEIPRDSIRQVTREDIRRAYANGRKRYRLVATAKLIDSPSANNEQTKTDANAASNNHLTSKVWEASVRLLLLPPSDPLYNLSGTDASVQFSTDVLAPVTVVSSNPTLVDTAYGLFADIVRVAGESKI